MSKPHLTLDRVWEISEKLKRRAEPLRYEDFTEWTSAYNDPINLAMYSEKGGLITPWIMDLLPVLMKEKEGGWLTYFISQSYRIDGIGDSAVSKMALYVIDLLDLNRQRLDVDWNGRFLLSLAEMDTEFEFTDRAFRSLRRWASLLKDGEILSDSVRFTQITQWISYEKAIELVDTPGPKQPILAMVENGGRILLRFTNILTVLCAHKDWDRLRRLWTRNENKVPRKNAILMIPFLRGTRDAPSFEFVLEEVLANPYIAPFVSMDELAEFSELLERESDNWPITTSYRLTQKWKATPSFQRVFDLVEGQNVVKELVKHVAGVAMTLVWHLHNNTRLPSWSALMEKAWRTTRTHFFYRGLTVRSFYPQVNTPISTTWYLPKAVGFAKMKNSLHRNAWGSVLVIRVPAGVPIVPIVPSASWTTQWGEDAVLVHEGHTFKQEFEVVLPSTATLKRVEDESQFLEEWYAYRYRNDINAQAQLRVRLVYVDFDFAGIGFSNR